jgi:hypothetical protein
MLDVNDTVRSYSGKTGCMCGCNGTYNDSTRARKLAITQILKQDFKVDDFAKADKDGTAGCVFVESETRNRVLYLTQAGVVAAQTLFQARAQ